MSEASDNDKLDTVFDLVDDSVCVSDLESDATESEALEALAEKIVRVFDVVDDRVANTLVVPEMVEESVVLAVIGLVAVGVADAALRESVAADDEVMVIDIIGVLEFVGVLTLQLVQVGS